MTLHRPAMTLLVAGATLSAACNGLPGQVAGASREPKASTASPKPGPAATKAPSPGQLTGTTKPDVVQPPLDPAKPPLVAADAVELRGRVLAPANVVSTYGAGVVSTYGAGLLSDGALSIVSDNGLIYRVLAAEPRPLANVEVFLADRAGNPLKDLPTVLTDAQGKYAFPKVPADTPYMVVARFNTKDRTQGVLRAMGSTKAGAGEVDVDGASTIVAAAANDGRKSDDLGDFDAAAYAKAVAAVRGRLTGDKGPNWASPADVLKVAIALAAEVAELKATIEQLRADMDRLVRRTAELERQIADLKAANLRLSFTTQTFPVGKRPLAFTMTPAGDPWVGCQDADTVLKLSGTTGEVLTTITLPKGAAPTLPLLRPDGGVWIPRFGDGIVSQHAAGGEQRKAVTLGDHPIVVVAAPDGKAFWVGSYESPTIKQLDAAGELVKSVDVGGPTTFLTFDPAGRLWVATAGGAIKVLDAGSGAPLATYTVAAKPRFVAMDATGTAWIQHNESAVITRVDQKDGRVLATHDLGQEIGAIALDEKRKSLWVSAPKSDRVIRVDFDGRILEPVPTGRSPLGVIVAPDGAIWVANSQDVTVTKVTQK